MQIILALILKNLDKTVFYINSKRLYRNKIHIIITDLYSKNNSNQILRRSNQTASVNENTGK